MNRITDSHYENIIYVSHNYGGLKDNEEKVANIINKLQEQYPTYLFLSPIHLFSYAYYEVENYQIGINMCLWLLDKSKEMWVYGDWKNSKGCNMEIEYCKEFDIPYKIKV